MLKKKNIVVMLMIYYNLKKYKIIYRNDNNTFYPWIVQKRYWIFWWKDYRTFRTKELAKDHIEYIINY